MLAPHTSHRLTRLVLPCLATWLVSCGGRTGLVESERVTSGVDAGEGDGGSVKDGGGNAPTSERLALGAFHSCAVKFGKGLYCWGSNHEGQLGIGDQEDSPSPRLVALPVEGSVTLLAAGYRHTCAAVERGANPGKLYCWGENVERQVSPAVHEPIIRTPVEVTFPEGAGSDVSALAAGEYHTCAGLSDGRLYCWGDNKNAQLGAGPDQVPGSMAEVTLAGQAGGVRMLAAGDFHTCAMFPASTWCWGANFHGQLGNGSTGEPSQPIQVAMAQPFADGLCSFGFFVLAKSYSGQQQQLWGWGEDSAGILGSGKTGATPPRLVASFPVLNGITAGLMHACIARWDDGNGGPNRVHCWGDGSYGQLGGSDALSQAKPTPIAADLDVLVVAAGAMHTCATTAEGETYCWGRNEEGQSGSPDGEATVIGPRKVTGF